jgi:hypothetical protein
VVLDDGTTAATRGEVGIEVRPVAGVELRVQITVDELTEVLTAQGRHRSDPRRATAPKRVEVGDVLVVLPAGRADHTPFDRVLEELGLEELAGAVEAAHDRAHGAVEDVRDLLV